MSTRILIAEKMVRFRFPIICQQSNKGDCVKLILPKAIVLYHLLPLLWTSPLSRKWRIGRLRRNGDIYCLHFDVKKTRSTAWNFFRCVWMRGYRFPKDLARTTPP